MACALGLQQPRCGAAAAPACRHLGSRHLGGGLAGLQLPSSLCSRSRLLATAKGRGAHLHVAAAASAPPAATTTLQGDDLKEFELRRLRTVADFDFWKKHRSSERYWRHVRGIFDSRTASWVAGPMSYVMLVTTGVCMYYTLAEAGILPEVIPEISASAAAPFGLTSFALSSLLVLRTNTSYQRWDEARKMWGLIVNRTRDIARQGLAYIPPHQAELQDMFCRWLVAYCRSLMCHLRAGEDLEAELTGKLTDVELAALLASTHRPNYVCQVLTSIIRRAQLPGWDVDYSQSGANVKASAAYRMDENLTVYADVTGGCERILRTPVPLSYSRHNSRFLIIWLTLLPFTLWDQCHWFTLPVTGLVAFLLLGIKEIGVVVEEPFSILPLERICDTIEGNVIELHSIHSAKAMQEQAAARAAGNGTALMDADDLVAAVAAEAAAAKAPAANGAVPVKA